MITQRREVIAFMRKKWEHVRTSREYFIRRYPYEPEVVEFCNLLHQAEIGISAFILRADRELDAAQHRVQPTVASGATDNQSGDNRASG